MDQNPLVKIGSKVIFESDTTAINKIFRQIVVGLGAVALLLVIVLLVHW